MYTPSFIAPVFGISPEGYFPKPIPYSYITLKRAYKVTSLPPFGFSPFNQKYLQPSTPL